MDVRHSKSSTQHPGARMPGSRPAGHLGWILPIALLALWAPAAADATPVPSSHFFGPPPADTSRVPVLEAAQPAARLNTWELIRESTHRLLEPDTRLLRFVTRYRVSQEIADKIVEEAVAAGIDPELGFRLVRVESRFQPRARGPGGSLGLTQLMPGTARRLDRSLQSEADILDPRTNLRLGFRYLRSMIDRYDDVRLGLLAYNRGPGAVDRALSRGQDPENGYSHKVLGTGANRYRGEGLLRAATSPTRTRATGD
jgi:soluble lytic murein transglycosylase-like protein